MKVGDLVRSRDGDIGLIIDYTPRFIKCLWSHGALESIGIYDVKVINEGR